MSFADFAGEIKTNMDTAMAAAVTAGLFGGTPMVYNYDKWPGALVGVSALIGQRKVDGQYGAGEPAVDHYDTKIWVYMPAFLTIAIAMGPSVDLYPIVRDQFAKNMQLSGKVEHILPAAPSMDGPGWFEYAGKKVIGVIFNFDVKENVSGEFTVSA
ncbi:MAG: hypothetical protein KAJ07_04775 [Planctomycetes bacterium]|nr:hypothetical protein [Planctomycetota bacterium]